MSLFNLVNRKELTTNLKFMLSANGIDFEAIIAKTREAHQAKLAEAADKRAEHSKLMKQSEQTRDQALSAAAAVLSKALDAVGVQALSAADLRVYAKDALDAARYFGRHHRFSPVNKHMNVLLTFLGKDNSVFAQMTDAANAKYAEAEKLEAAASLAQEQADKAHSSAQAAALEAFNKAVAAAQPNLDNAAELEKMAAALIKSANFFA